jgi:hypothetical protein
MLDPGSTRANDRTRSKRSNARGVFVFHYE